MIFTQSLCLHGHGGFQGLKALRVWCCMAACALGTELSYNWCFDLTSKAWRGWTWSPLLPCFKVRVAWPLPVVKYNPLERKTRVLFVRVSVWIITCEFKHSYCMCVQVCTCTRVLKVFLRTGLCMRTRLPISLETSCLRGARVDEC